MNITCDKGGVGCPCDKGGVGCPGKVPLCAHQCRPHRLYARFKAKSEACKGQSAENPWTQAILKDVATKSRKGVVGCTKDCCLKVLSAEQQVESRTHVPGLSGLKHDVDKTPQPLFKPGYWEAEVGNVKDRGTGCTENCCCRAYLPTEIDIWVKYVSASRMYGIQSPFASHQKDPKRTRSQKTRKMLAKKKELARMKRSERLEKKFNLQFKNKESEIPTSTPLMKPQDGLPATMPLLEESTHFDDIPCRHSLAPISLHNKSPQIQDPKSSSTLVTKSQDGLPATMPLLKQPTLLEEKLLISNNETEIISEPPNLMDSGENNNLARRRTGWFSGIGLKGGADRNPREANRNPKQIGLKLINGNGKGTANICFINSVIQMFRMTGYAAFILTQLPPLQVGNPERYKGCSGLLNLYSEQTARARSAAYVRKCVAQHSGKPYLNNGTQQDAEEFLHCLVAMVSTELATSVAFSAVQSHWGSEQIRRVFLDNPPSGTCKKCGKYPSSRVEEFLTLQLTIPISASCVTLTSLITNYFSESTESVKIKCTFCCPHEKNKVLCPQTGFCSRPASTQIQLTEAPQFLFLTLLRFGNGHLGQKVTTLVKMEAELVFPNDDKYELVAALNHIGSTIRAGHYVTYSKKESGQWLLFDDTNIQPSTLEQANTQDNYILLYKKTSDPINTDPDILSAKCQHNINREDPDVLPAKCQNYINEDPDILTAKCQNNIKEVPDLLTAKCQNNKKEVPENLPCSSIENHLSNIDTTLDLGKLNIDVSSNSTNEAPVEVDTLSALCKPNSIKSSTESKQISNEEMDCRIKDLENKLLKSAMEKDELKKLKSRRGKRKYRQKMNEEQKKQTKEQCKNAWNSMSEEQREARTEEMRNRNRAAWNSMSEEQREASSDKDKNRKKASRDSMSEEQREASNDKDKHRMKASRDSMSEEQKNSSRDKDKHRKKASMNGHSVVSRLQMFRNRVRWGPSYPCVTCHQTLFKHQVNDYYLSDLDILLAKLQIKCSESLLTKALCIPKNFYRTVERKIDKEDRNQITFEDGGTDFFLCKVCYSYLKKGKLPPKAALNCLDAVPIPDHIRLNSHLEEALIARILLFIKIYPLRSSLMPAMKDRCVVIPLDQRDVINTVESLPRLPSESGIIDIQWKRRVGQKNFHLQAKVDPTKLFKALEFLKACGNKHYHTTQTREEYEARCQSDDPEGFNLIFGDEEPNYLNLRLKFFPDGSAEPIVELQNYLEINEEQKLEDQYMKCDVVRKYQIDYDEHVCMVEKYPEAMQTQGVLKPTSMDEEIQAEDALNNASEEDPDILSAKCQHNINREDPDVLPAKCQNYINEDPDILTAKCQNYINEDPDILTAKCQNYINGEDPENSVVVVAPGEGKIPINLTYCKDWDAKAFPMLHPDGLNHLSDERRQKISDLEYFKQRLFNLDSRWRDNPHWVFAAAVFREKKDFQRNIDLAYKRGRQNTSKDGKTMYTLEDPYSVFQSVANTPAYHKKGKMEMMARLDNFGPFQIFFTLSCADYRWQENLTSVLRERGISVRVTIDLDQTESYEVLTEAGYWMSMDDYIGQESDETLHEVLRKNVVTATRNYQQRVQALMQTIVRNPSNPLSVKHYSLKLEFQGRGAGHNHGVLWLDVEKIEKKVDVLQLQHLKDHHSSECFPAKCQNNNNNDDHLKNPWEVHASLDRFLITRGIRIEKTPNKKKHKSLRYLKKLINRSKHTKLSPNSQKVLEDLKLIYPLYGLKISLRKLNNHEEATEEEVATVVNFVDTFSTVSLHPAIVGSIVANIAKMVNQHRHTKTCRKYQTVCRFKFPKLPSFKTIIARPPGKYITGEEKKCLEEKHNAVIKKVTEVLENEETMNSILNDYPKELETTVAEATEGRAKRINAVLEMAGLVTDEDKLKYQMALEYSSSGCKVIMARDIDELWVNPYNPEITRAWNGNTDFQICLDFYAIITYVTEYYTKDDTGLIKTLVNTLKASDCEDVKDKMKLLMNVWIKNRQMGEAEAVYRLTKEFRFRESDAACIFVQTSQKSERSKILKNVTDKPEFRNMPKITVKDQKDKEYVEQYDINSKYERRPKQEALDILSFSQMAKMYRSSWKKEEFEFEEEDALNNESEEDPEILPAKCQNNIKEVPDILTAKCQNNIKEVPDLLTAKCQNNKKEVPDILTAKCQNNINEEDLDILPAKFQNDINNPKSFPDSQTETSFSEEESDDDSEEENSDGKFQHVMAYGWDKGKGPALPKVFKLKASFPGEPPYMKLRTSPAVLRFHKYKVDKDPEAYWFSEAMLYMPHVNEEDLVQKIHLAKAGGQEAWEEFVQRIDQVKSQIMEYLVDNEEARMMAAEIMINDALTGEYMDPEGEQELEDNRLDTFELNEEFEHLDPDYVETPAEDTFEKSYRHIEVRPLPELRREAKKLDFYQRKVLEIGIKHARGLVQARGGKNPPPFAPLCMVDGAAGAGKSCTINILKEFVQLIMQRSGDSPDCPYILLCAPTGTASVNIKGQTLHSAFGFTFGDEHYSLPDKTRDGKRAAFKNLRFLIIDEVSMVKADQLYQLDLRLREITMRPNKLFGEIALFFFGDIMQLKPVMGRYIWCQPRCDAYLHAFLVESHWDKFSVISLIENHRQHGDAQYADILNRIRLGEQTDNDMSLLQERVRPEGHPDMRGALVIASKHVVVNKYNELYLQALKSELLVIEAINTHKNIPAFKPKIHKMKATVDPTPYLQTLRLKLGCRVMLTVNLDVKDCLCNGSIGTLLGFLRNKNSEEVKILMVKFDSKDSGREMRRCHPQLAKHYPECTPIKKQIHKYSTSSSSGARANSATVQQFPLILSFATTTHKIQGQTIKAPQKVAVDLRSVFGPNQAYVMLGRVEERSQIYLINCLPENKITTSQEALKQLACMKAKSLNMNPPVWEKTFGESIKVLFHNIHSLNDKLEDVKADLLLPFADVLIFSETWLEENVPTNELYLNGYQLHLNSRGRGKGIATYFNNKFVVLDDVRDEHLQITTLESENLFVIGVYRSNDDKSLATHLKEIIPDIGSCLVIGDFNFCSRKFPNHEVILTMKSMGFDLLISRATHFDGGHLDQAWLRETSDASVVHSMDIYCPYYNCKDHDALLFSRYEPCTEQGAEEDTHLGRFKSAQRLQKRRGYNRSVPTHRLQKRRVVCPDEIPVPRKKTAGNFTAAPPPAYAS